MTVMCLYIWPPSSLQMQSAGPNNVPSGTARSWFLKASFQVLTTNGSRDNLNTLRQTQLLGIIVRLMYLTTASTFH